MFIKDFLRLLFAIFATLMAYFFGKRARRQEPEVLIWGTTPLISYKYWSQAMKQAGLNSTTIMSHHYSVNSRQDFDLYFEDIVPAFVRPARLRRELAPFVAFSYIIKEAAVLHASFLGGPLGQSRLWKLEAYLLKRAGIRTVMLPFGADVYMYSQVMDPAVRNSLLVSYPDAAKQEPEIAERVRYWTRHADIIIPGTNLDGIGRWDVPVGNNLCIDTMNWHVKHRYSTLDGITGPVKIMHAPNHRGVKGTEFLINSIEKIQEDGLQIELVLLENVSNDKVRELMHEVDILADQFVLPGYGLNAIEGMASGLPVLCNIDDDAYAQVFRRYSFLNECPIVSASVESIKQNLRALIVDPRLREELGRAGRLYVEKYHSYEMAQYLYGSIYDRILYGKEVDLMNLFHPLMSDFNRRKPLVRHPLIGNQLPPKYLIRATERELVEAVR